MEKIRVLYSEAGPTLVSDPLSTPASSLRLSPSIPSKSFAGDEVTSDDFAGAFEIPDDLQENSTSSTSTSSTSTSSTSTSSVTTCKMEGGDSKLPKTKPRKRFGRGLMTNSDLTTAEIEKLQKKHKK